MQIGSHKGKKWAIRMAPAGTADILALYPLYDASGFRPLWIEVKATKGKQSELQKSFELDVTERGTLVYRRKITLMKWKRF